MNKIAVALRLMGAGSLALLAGQAMASGYHFGTQSVSSQGVANSNGAEATDATVIFYNPAGLTRLKGDNISGALIVVDPHIDVSNLRSTNAEGATIYGPGGDSPTSPVLVPQMYWAHQFNDQMYGGLGLFVPFGDKTKYDDNWAGRYNGIDLDMMTFAINPQFAYKVNDQLSIGVGATVQYMKAKFKKKADFGTLASTSLPAFAQALAAQGVVLTPTQLHQAAEAMMSNTNYDGELSYEGDDWAFGFNLGVLWEVDETLRLGAAYRSSISHKLEGDADWSRPSSFGNSVFASLPMVGPTVNGAWNSAVQAGLNGQGFTDGNGTVNVDTPDSFSMNFFKQLNDKFAVMGDWTHTWHNKFKELRLGFDSGLPDAVIDQSWKSTNRYSVGTTYQYSGPLKLRAGIAFDESPVPSDDERIANLPDSDRIWYSIGANYAFSKDISLDVAYTYVHIADSSMNNTECVLPSCTGSGTNTKADFESYANIFGAQLNYRF
ncbi:OmpP1/FadL family transporter [Chitiniphilus eburneus]|uniref:Transporter n=1 Tax=Chitiniphilus eburneus TaxID=2571148 RepID=A0A4V5MP13_9NEIS|nr:OmpP1/FadL family transporter [Chitiniphilus eburneus]TJZ66118.1 transporter [Chitiniphilus eburneus]